MRGGFRAGVLAAAALLVLGCSARFEAFGFQTAEGARIDIRQSERRARDTETIFQPTAARPFSPVYTLGKPLAVAARGQAFAISYTSSLLVCTLAILSDPKTVFRKVTLPPSSGTPLRYLVPLSEGDRIWGFQLSDSSNETAAGSLEMRGVGTAPFVHGFAIEGNGLTVDGSLEVLSASPTGSRPAFPPGPRMRWSRESG